MSKIKLYILSIISIVGLNMTTFGLVLAQRTPVEFVVPDTTLQISGVASPGALVSIFEGNSLIGTTVANGQARFSKKFTALEPGLRKLRIEYVDKLGRKSTAVNDTASLGFQKETSLEYFLPPTLDIVPQSVIESDSVSFQGSSSPNTQIILVVDGGNTVLRPQTDSQGNYSISLATDGFFIGEHPVSAKADSANKTSYESEKKSFNVQPSPAKQSSSKTPSSLDPPIITEPTSPNDTDKDQITVRGTAAANQQIIIFIDGEPVGSTFSNDKGEWFFNLRLTSKKQLIRAITCVGSDCSDFSNEVEVNFTGEFGACSNFKFSLDDYRFWGINPNNGIEVAVSQISGEKPYTVVLSWGDGIEEKFDTPDESGFKLQHVYKYVGQFNGEITLEDSRGCIYSRNFSVDVQPKQFKPIDYWWAAPAMLTVGFALLLRYRRMD